MNLDQLLKPEDVCEILSISMPKFRMMIFKKEIPYLKIGRLVRIKESDLKNLMDLNLH